MVLDCSDELLLIIGGVLVINVQLWLSSLYFIIKYVDNEMQKPKEKKSPKILYYGGLIFLIISSICLLFWSTMPMDICYTFISTTEGYTYFKITQYSWLVQLYFLWLTLFIKLYLIFKDSIYKLSIYTLRFFAVLFTLLPLAMWLIINIIIHVTNDGRYAWIAFICFGVFSLILSCLFVYKLFKVYRDSQQLRFQDEMNLDDKILSTITRTTILALTSLLMSILCPVILYIYYPSIHYEYGSLMNYEFPILDIYTNFICIALTFSVFNDQYKTVCGFCDTKCKYYTFKMVSKEVIRNHVNSESRSQDVDEEENILYQE